MEESLVAELLATVAVTALVGTRIYPQVAPQATKAAYVIYDVVANRRVHDHSGAAGLTRGRISFLCHASTYAEAKAIAAAVLTALDGRRGAVQGTVFGAILSEDDADAGWDEITRMHVVAVDFHVQVQEV